MTTKPERWLTEEEKRKIRAAIDRYEWKHSWHLQTDRNGYTNWDSNENLIKCRHVLEEYRREALQFAAACDILAGRIKSVQEAIAAYEAECDEADKSEASHEN
jgi:crotonobetainyl-CoA:carnitine CoA-transferase CaiB-like acyl-CoA transferase